MIVVKPEYIWIRLISKSFLFIIGLNVDIIGDVDILTFVFNSGKEFVDLIHFDFLLVIYLIWFLVQNTVFQELNFDLTIDWRKSLGLDDL